MSAYVSIGQHTHRWSFRRRLQRQRTWRALSNFRTFFAISGRWVTNKLVFALLCGLFQNVAGMLYLMSFFGQSLVGLTAWGFSICVCVCVHTIIHTYVYTHTYTHTHTHTHWDSLHECFLLFSPSLFMRYALPCSLELNIDWFISVLCRSLGMRNHARNAVFRTTHNKNKKKICLRYSIFCTRSPAKRCDIRTRVGMHNSFLLLIRENYSRDLFSINFPLTKNYTNTLALMRVYCFC